MWDADFEATSSDGSRVFFTSEQQLTAGDTDGDVTDVYERSDDTTTLLSATTVAAAPGTDVSFEGASADGARVFFETDAKLTADDNDSNRDDVYLAGDITAPDTSITGGPAGATTDSTPEFAFESTEGDATFTCSVDGAAFSSCTTPLTLGPLALGAHSFRVRATDTLGNTDATPAVRDFTVEDPAPPPGVDTTAPAGRLSGRRVQRLARRVVLRVACLDEACTAGVRGRLRARYRRGDVTVRKTFRLKQVSQPIAAGQSATFRLRLSARVRRQVTRALRRRGSANVRVTAVLADAAGNTTVLRRTVRLRLR